MDQVKKISYEDLQILLDTLDKECARVAKVADQLASCSDKEVMPALRPKQVIQSVMAISIFLGRVETLELSEACEKMTLACLEFDKAKGIQDIIGYSDSHCGTVEDFVKNLPLEHSRIWVEKHFGPKIKSKAMGLN